MPCLLYHVSMQSLSLSIIVDLAFSQEIFLLSLYLGFLVNNFLNFLFPMIGKSPVTLCRWYFFIKPQATPLHSKTLLSWKKALTFRLGANLSKLIILNLIVFVSDYITMGLSNSISADWHTFTDESKKNIRYINELNSFT